MYVKKLVIENFRGIRKMELDLHPQMNVLIGVNGAGKSSVLDALAMSFSRSPLFSDGNALPVCLTDISNDNDSIFIGLYCEASDSEYIVNMAYSERHQSSDTISNNEEMASGSGYGFTDLGSRRKRILNDDRTLDFPVVAYYPSSRAIRGNGNFSGFSPVSSQLDALKGAISSSPDFRSFFARYTEGAGNINRYINSRPGIDKQIDFFMKWYDAQLKAVFHSIRHITSDTYALSANPKTFEMVINKDIRSFGIYQLSDGEKSLIALVGDIAIRLAIANPSLENPLHGEALVLIDEIDLHLHPQWQRMILPKLMDIFPNTQFIVTTHSPQVVGEIEKEKGKIIPLQDGDNGIEALPDFNVFGQSSDVILEDVMNAPKRNDGISQILDGIFKAIKANDLVLARKKMEELEGMAEGIPEMAAIELLLRRKEKFGK